MPRKESQIQFPLPETAVDCKGTQLHYGDIVFVREDQKTLFDFYRQDYKRQFESLYGNGEKNSYYSYSTKSQHRFDKNGQHIIDIPTGIPELNDGRRPFIYIGDIKIGQQSYPYFSPLSHIDLRPQKNGDPSHACLKYLEFENGYNQSYTNPKCLAPIPYFYGQRIPLTKEEPFSDEFDRMINQAPNEWRSDLVIYWSLPLASHRIQKLDFDHYQESIQEILPSADLEGELKAKVGRQKDQKILLDQKDKIQQLVTDYAITSSKKYNQLFAELKKDFNNELSLYIDPRALWGINIPLSRQGFLIPNPLLQKHSMVFFGGNQAFQQKTYLLDKQQNQKELTPDEKRKLEQEISDSRRHVFSSDKSRQINNNPHRS